MASEKVNEGEQQQSFELETLTITATRIEKPITAIPDTITILDQQTIDHQTAIFDDLPSILEHTVPGFGPSLKKLTGRGESFRGRNPLFLIDGVPQHNALRDGSRDGKTIDTDFIERIEVIHGSNAIQGIGATGGVVNMVTKSPRPDGEWSNEIKLRLTTHDNFDEDGFGYKITGLSGKKFGIFDVIAGLALHQRGLFFDSNGDAIGIYQTQGDIMDSFSHDVFFKAGLEPDDNQRLQLMVNYFELERDADFRPVAGDRQLGRLTTTVEGDPSADVGDPATNENTTVSLNYRHQDLFEGELVSQLYYQDFSALFEGGTFGGFFRLTPDGPPFLDQSEIQSEKLGAKFIYAYRGLEIESLVPAIGYDYAADKSSQVLARSGREWVPETELTSHAPFVQVDYTAFERLHLSGGFRYEIADIEVDDYTTIAAAGSTPVAGGNPDFNEFLPNIGMSLDVLPEINLFVSYAEGLTMPDAGRVLRSINTPGQDVDTLLDLEPIVTENIDLGIKLFVGQLAASFTYYWSNSDLGQRLDPNPEGIFEVRREKTEIEGLEFVIDYDITDTIAAGLNYTWLKGEFDSDGDDRVDSDLGGPDIAPNRLNLYATADFLNGWSGRLQLSYLFDRDFRGPDAPNNADFDGYGLVDLVVAKDTKFGRFSVAVENLLDKQHVVYFAQTDPVQSNNTFFAGNGRTLNFTYQKEF